MHTETYTSRAEAIKAAAATTAASIGTSPAAAFAMLKSLYAGGAPVAKRGRTATATVLFANAAARAGVDVRELSAVNAVPLTQGIDPALATAVYRVACELAPAARAAQAANPCAQVLAYAAQDRLAGRACSSYERDNFKSRVMSRLLLDVAELVCDQPDLLDAHDPLTTALLARVAAGTAATSTTGSGGDRWNTSWLGARRRENGSERPVCAATPHSRAAWATLVRDTQGSLRRAAKRIAGSTADGDDLLQSALERMFGNGEPPAADAFVPFVIVQMKRTHADLQVTGRDRAGHRPVSLDAATSSGDVHAKTPEQLAFGSSTRESQALDARTDGRLDAQATLAAAMDAASAADDEGDNGIEASLDRAAVLAELGRIIERARRGDSTVDEVTDREQLIRHLGAAALAAGAASKRAARTAVIDALASVALAAR